MSFNTVTASIQLTMSQWFTRCHSNPPTRKAEAMRLNTVPGQLRYRRSIAYAAILASRESSAVSPVGAVKDSAVMPAVCARE